MPIQPSDQRRLLDFVLSKRGCKPTAEDRLQAFAQGVQAAVQCLSPIVTLDEGSSQPASEQPEGGPQEC